MSVIKRSKASSAADLCQAIREFAEKLSGQKGEEEAVEFLKDAAQKMEGQDPKSEPFITTVKTFLNDFEDEHELGVYSQSREGEAGQWSDTQVLYLACSRVISLARRFA